MCVLFLSCYIACNMILAYIAHVQLVSCKISYPTLVAHACNCQVKFICTVATYLDLSVYKILGMYIPADCTHAVISYIYTCKYNKKLTF